MSKDFIFQRPGCLFRAWLERPRDRFIIQLLLKHVEYNKNQVSIMLYFSSIISGIILGFFWVTLKSIILEFSSIMYLTLVIIHAIAKSRLQTHCKLMLKKVKPSKQNGRWNILNYQSVRKIEVDHVLRADTEGFPDHSCRRKNQALSKRYVFPQGLWWGYE